VIARVLFAGVLAATPAAAQPAAPTPSVRALLQSAQRQASDGDGAAALESLRTARAIAPNSEEILSAFAQLALATHVLGPAVATLDSLTRMCPTVGQYHYLLGVALMEAGDMPAAVVSLEQANRIEPERPRTLLALALAMNSRKQYREAKAAALKSLELDPENIEAVAALAEAEAGTGDIDRAEDHARRVLARAAAHPTAHLVIGIVRMQQERYADARDALERAVAANPGSAAAHYQLSLAFARLGDETRSQQHVEMYRQKLRETEDRIKAVRSTPSGEKRP
jgi:tetratricopeptide (TPR) repeat protein